MKVCTMIIIQTIRMFKANPMYFLNKVMQILEKIDPSIH